MVALGATVLEPGSIPGASTKILVQQVCFKLGFALFELDPAEIVLFRSQWNWKA